MVSDELQYSQSRYHGIQKTNPIVQKVLTHNLTSIESSGIINIESKRGKEHR